MKTLKDKRKEFLEYLKEQFGEDSKIPYDIMRRVLMDDEQFTKDLKIKFKDYLGYGRGTSDVDYIIDGLSGGSA